MQFTMKMVIGNIRDKTADINLVPGQSLVIGRSNAADYLLMDSSVSSRHASLVCEADSVFLTDLGSRNGTFVNESRIQKTTLSDNDKVRIGTCVFRVSMADRRKQLRAERTERSEGFSGGDSSLSFKEPGTEVQPMKLSEDGFVSEGSIAFGNLSKSGAPSIPPANEVVSERRKPPVKAGKTEIRNRLKRSEQFRVVVDFVPPEGDGDRIVLNSGQHVSFGKSGLADFEIRDSNLDDLHFRIFLSNENAVLTDNQSLYGTFLNGQQITKAELTDGDEVIAGRTKFTFLMPRLDSSEPEREIVSFNAPVAAASAPKRTVDRKIFETQLVMLGQEKIDPEEVEDLIVDLAKLGRQFFIVDFVRIAQPLPDDLDVGATMLFDWIPAAASLQSPHLIEMEKLENWKQLVSFGWGCDGLMLLQSELQSDELVEKFRKMIRGSTKKGNYGGAINGICWPSVLGNILKNNFDDFATMLTSDVKHVFLETVGGGGWQLFAEQKHADRIVREARMTPIDPEPEEDVELNDGLTTESE